MSMKVESSDFFVNFVSGAGTISMVPSAYGRSACCEGVSGAGSGAGVLRDDPPVEGDGAAGNLARIDGDGKRHVFLVALCLQKILAAPREIQVVRCGLAGGDFVNELDDVLNFLLLRFVLLL